VYIHSFVTSKNVKWRRLSIINQSFIWVRRHGPYTGTHTNAHNTQ